MRNANIETERETVLIGSDRSHRFVSIHPRIIIAARHDMNQKRYSRGSAGEYIRVGYRTAEDKQSAVWCCILIDAPAADQEARAEKKKRTRRRTEAEVEQATGARREGVMKHRADTPP